MIILKHSLVSLRNSAKSKWKLHAQVNAFQAGRSCGGRGRGDVKISVAEEEAVAELTKVNMLTKRPGM